jgi:hypothetical protein
MSSELNRVAGDAVQVLSRVAGDLVEHRAVQPVLTQAFAARERLTQLQETTLAALNLPTAAESERITRRVRSVAQRMDGMEEALDRIEQQLRAAARAGQPDTAAAEISAQLVGLQERLDELAGSAFLTAHAPD